MEQLLVFLNTPANGKTLVKLILFHYIWFNLIRFQVSVKQLPYFLAEGRIQQFIFAAIFVSSKRSSYLLPSSSVVIWALVSSRF